MSDHSRALVPIESWYYGSPFLSAQGRSIDIGLFLESLIYYDQVLLNTANAPQFSDLLRWFVDRGEIDHLIALMKTGEIGVYDYAFHSAPILKDGVISIWNIVDPVQEQPNSYERRVLYHSSVDAVLHNRRQRKQLYTALRDHVLEVKAPSFDKAVENARADGFDPDRFALALQAFVDEIYREKLPNRKPPQITVQWQSKDDRSRVYSSNINIKELNAMLGPESHFDLQMAFGALAACNKFLFTSAQSGVDLYLPSPMSVVVGNKLYEASAQSVKTKSVIEQLQSEVDFPDVRALVNSDDLKFRDVMAIRAKSKQFRRWLQTESDRDRNAIIAYHNEVARELGIVRGIRKTLRMFGVLGGAAAGVAVTSHLSSAAQDQTLANIIGAMAGAGSGYLIELAAHLGEGDWKPVVFGNWYIDRITELLAKKKDDK